VSSAIPAKKYGRRTVFCCMKVLKAGLPPPRAATSTWSGAAVRAGVERAPCGDDLQLCFAIVPRFDGKNYLPVPRCGHWAATVRYGFSLRYRQVGRASELHLSLSAVLFRPSSLDSVRQRCLASTSKVPTTHHVLSVTPVHRRIKRRPSRY
jgi:hypothetical protein